MNYPISDTSPYAAILPTIRALFADVRGPVPADAESYELQDTVLRGGGFAVALPADVADSLNAQAAQIDADREAAAEAARIAAENAPPPVPFSVSPWQMRRALNQLGLRTSVDAAVASGDQDVQDAWEYALEIRRDNQLLAGMAAALGMNDAQLDDLFRLAESFQ